MRWTNFQLSHGTSLPFIAHKSGLRTSSDNSAIRLEATAGGSKDATRGSWHHYWEQEATSNLVAPGLTTRSKDAISLEAIAGSFKQFVWRSARWGTSPRYPG